MNAIQLSGVSTAVVVPASEAIEYRDGIIKHSSAITSVENDTGLLVIKQQVHALKDLARTVEKNRVEVKAVPLKITRDIDAISAQFISPVEVEIKRLEAVANNYAREQLKIQQERERLARIEREAAQKKIDDEAKAQREEARKAHEQQLREQEAARVAQGVPKPNAFAAARLAAVLSVQEQKIEAQAEEAKAQVIEQTTVAPVSVPVKKVVKWEVVDIVELTKAHVDLVRIEPNTRAIQTRVNAGVRSIPGVRIWEETEVKL